MELSLQEERVPDKRVKPEEIDEELMQRIQAGLATLSPRHRIVFEMYDLKHIPQKQIAAKLNIPHGTVRSRLHYARKKMRQFMKK